MPLNGFLAHVRSVSHLEQNTQSEAFDWSRVCVGWRARLHLSSQKAVFLHMHRGVISLIPAKPNHSRSVTLWQPCEIFRFIRAALRWAPPAPTWDRFSSDREEDGVTELVVRGWDNDWNSSFSCPHMFPFTLNSLLHLWSRCYITSLSTRESCVNSLTMLTSKAPWNPLTT